MCTENEIIKGLKSGDEDAYKYLYDSHYGALCLYAAQYVKDSFIAETIVGDVIFNIWQKREELNINYSLRSYLAKSVKNQCLNYFVRQNRLEEIKSELKTEMKLNEAYYEGEYTYPLSRIIEEELDLKLQDSLNKLPELTRKIFELSRFSDMKYQEIAKITGLSVDSIKYHIKSALAKLRDDLKNCFITLFLLFFL
ncbi:RNA polymerase sigma-70 factor (ECF subfamily) [Dysgonomonas hofstadii]|uniref:RNA polymerase sigma-70 factor (ECF subfamily) n=1 Tax=Dysgonomonas hofstadii TaxID=637886 RepID=A0A840CNY6_9BACT|nr:RNA polymerase sigma-70 factor [Dysgonomonas hofstadii]MBB4036801.1 RNA polymerase sigma-70 factor (ECF subfamily) [Dysgonomonas hofstadii]